MIAVGSHLARLPSLRYFAEVAHSGSFRRAAEKLHIAPSAISRQIKNLEDTLGVELMTRDRGRGGLELTEAGQILLNRCVSVFNELTIAREEIGALAGLQKGHLRLGLNEVLAADLLPVIIGDLTRTFPGLRYSIFVENTPDIVRRLFDGDIDVGMAYNFPPSSDLETLLTINRKAYLITSLDHPLAGRTSIAFSEIVDENFIFPDSSIALNRMIEDLLAQTGVNVTPIMYTNSFALLRQMVQNNLGVSVVIGSFMENVQEKLAFIEISGPSINRKSLSCCRVAGRTPSAATIAFVETARQLFSRYGNDA